MAARGRTAESLRPTGDRRWRMETGVAWSPGRSEDPPSCWWPPRARAGVPRAVASRGLASRVAARAAQESGVGTGWIGVRGRGGLVEWVTG